MRTFDIVMASLWMLLALIGVFTGASSVLIMTYIIMSTITINFAYIVMKLDALDK